MVPPRDSNPNWVVIPQLGNKSILRPQIGEHYIPAYCVHTSPTPAKIGRWVCLFFAAGEIAPHPVEDGAVAWGVGV